LVYQRRHTIPSLTKPESKPGQKQNKAYETIKFDVVPLLDRIESMIQAIIPNKPDVVKLKKDLIGRRISEGVDGYRMLDSDCIELGKTVSLRFEIVAICSEV
jgi:hypothetical protein